MTENRRFNCPELECGRSFASIGALKTHMERKHHGYTDEQISAAIAPPISSEEQVESAPAGQAWYEPQSAPPEEPKRMTRVNRELNEKFNEALQLIIKHLMNGPLDELEKQNLDGARRELTSAVVGVEFDFERRLFTLSNKFFMILALLCLYFGERLPTFSDLRRMISEQRAKPSVRIAQQPSTEPAAEKAN